MNNYHDNEKYEIQEPMSPQILTLFELNSLVRQTLERTFHDGYWVKAELSDVREKGGHCYMELVQFANDERRMMANSTPNRTPVAKAYARCWSSTWQFLRPEFERVTGQTLRAGMQVLLKVYPQFHEAYGFSWVITDMNPEYTIGDMMRRRQEIIRQLKEEGVFDLQRGLTIPMFAQRIAVISSASAAGYGDFSHQLANNPYGFCFHTELFPAVMQGEQVEASVIAALDQIYERMDEFDVVVIIRGGGATTDMSGFDTLMLAENIANFSLPIITGIGHDRDESVLDMVSHTRVKTPTAVAVFLIDHLKTVDERISIAERSLVSSVADILQYQQLRLQRVAQQISHLPRQRISNALHSVELRKSLLHHAVIRLLDKRKYDLSAQDVHLQNMIPRLIEKWKYHLLALDVKLKAFDPQTLLQRGYSITLHDGKAVRDPSLLQPGDVVETRVEHGTFTSIVTDPK